MLHQFSDHWIGMDVSQLLSEPVLAPNIEVVIALLPEMKLSARVPHPSRAFCDRVGQLGLYFFGHILFKHLQRNGQFCAFRFSDQQVHVLRHNDIGGYAKPVPLARTLKRLLKNVASRWRKQRFTVITTAGNEMQAASFLKTFKTPWHDAIVLRK